MYIRNFNRQNIEYLKNDFININRQIVLSEIQILLYVVIILLIFEMIWSKKCPLIIKKAKINTLYNPWLTNKLKNAINKKNKLFSLYKSTNCMSILNRYKN